jgi:hypothetical protein
MEVNFSGLHNCAKHVIHIAEAVESSILVLDGTRAILEVDDKAIGELEDTSKRELIRRQLKDRLRYRRSLFQSTKLRLTSLQKRVENAITLSFNLVTQQDSLVMIQDSNSMKIIAAITMIFLPTTGVATVIGSQLFVTSLSANDGSWEVNVTPLFVWLWWISGPLTLFVILLAYLWHYWTHHGRPLSPLTMVLKSARTFRSATTSSGKSEE